MKRCIWNESIWIYPNGQLRLNKKSEVFKLINVILLSHNKSRIS